MAMRPPDGHRPGLMEIANKHRSSLSPTRPGQDVRASPTDVPPGHVGAARPVGFSRHPSLSTGHLSRAAARQTSLPDNRWRGLAATSLACVLTILIDNSTNAVGACSHRPGGLFRRARDLWADSAR